MTGAARPPGIVRLGCVLMAAALVALAGAVFLVVQATATPDLGPPPGGADDGHDDNALAAHLSLALAPVLLPGHAHGTAVLSERDLTTLVADHAPADSSFRDPEVRVRDGRLVVSGLTSVGPIGVVGTGRVALRLVTGADGMPDVAADIEQVEAGRLTLPGFLRSAIADRVSGAVQLGGLISSHQSLQGLRPLLECVAIRPEGVVLGVHASGLAPDPGTCTR